MACQHLDIQKLKEVCYCLSCGGAVPGSEESMSPYKYHRLKYTRGQEIRLILLHPGRDQQDLKCEIEHVNLLDQPAYEAVSYTWGSGILSEQILCNGRTMSITANCRAALRCLRLSERRRALWIDAVCIDQRNDVEKSHQVQLMSTIYSSASQVLAYLAPTSPSKRRGVKTALELLNDLSSSHQVSSCFQVNSFIDLITLPYWRRVWILQEIGLAKLVTLVTEDACADWTSSAAGALLGQCQAFGEAPSGALTWAPGVQREELHLLDALCKSRNSLATDPRDKVFALLGLTQTRFSEVIPVDYSLSSNDLYAKVACHMIMDLGRMDVLKHTANQPLILASAASWIPRWDECDTYEPLPIQFEPDTVELLASSWFRPVEDLKVLVSIPGHVPTNSRSIDKPGGDFRYKICERRIENDCLVYAASIPPCLRIRAHLLDRIQEVLLYDCDSWSTGKRKSLRPAFRGISPCQSCQVHFQQSIRCKNPSNFHMNQRGIYISLAEEWAIGISFIKTQHSEGFTRCREFPGPSIQAGDQIWALAGVDVPFILRSNGSHYVLLAECLLYRATLPFPCPCCGVDAEGWPMTTKIIDIW
ncbi:heterokaryon incompatibility protein-domain-containing protein [Paraphoma chrysanthemicola]|nr:heterokaryon incompatibility protein-domain-containing protein [Paraphoma chrysanthemicola]